MHMKMELYDAIEHFKQQCIQYCQDTFKEIPPLFDEEPAIVRRNDSIEVHQPAYPNTVFVLTFYDDGKFTYEKINIWE